MLTMLLVISTLQAFAVAASVPFRGAGSSRLLYLALLGGLGAISAAMTGLGLALASPESAAGPLGRARALAERYVPAWIATCATGAAVCLLLRGWVGAG